MAQGNKNKVKAKLPANAKHKSNAKTNKKNSAFQKRKRAPVPKKMIGKLKIQDAITKSVNLKNETEMKKRAISSGNQILSKAQQAVQQHHQKKEESMSVDNS